MTKDIQSTIYCICYQQNRFQAYLKIVHRIQLKSNFYWLYIEIDGNHLQTKRQNQTLDEYCCVESKRFIL